MPGTDCLHQWPDTGPQTTQRIAIMPEVIHASRTSVAGFRIVHEQKDENKVPVIQRRRLVSIGCVHISLPGLQGWLESVSCLLHTHHYILRSS